MATSTPAGSPWRDIVAALGDGPSFRVDPQLRLRVRFWRHLAVGRRIDEGPDSTHPGGSPRPPWTPRLMPLAAVRMTATEPPGSLRLLGRMPLKNEAACSGGTRRRCLVPGRPIGRGNAAEESRILGSGVTETGQGEVTDFGRPAAAGWRGTGPDLALVIGLQSPARPSGGVLMPLSRAIIRCRPADGRLTAT